MTAQHVPRGRADDNGACKKAYASWEKERSSGRLRARDTDFFHGTCKNARLRLDAEEAPADGKVAELEAKLTAALEAKFAALEAKLTATQ